MILSKESIDKALSRIIDNKHIFSAIFHIENEDRSFVHTSAAGDIQPGQQYFIASVTKFFVTAVMLKLMEGKQVSLHDRIGKYLPGEIMQNLHIYRGKDYSNELRVLHLLSNTSGIPDYFFHKNEDGNTVADSLIAGRDEPWPLEKTIELTRKMKPKFRFGTKAAYSDTNYQLLGRIIEIITGKPIGEVFREFIFDPLQLKNTYAYTDPADIKPALFYAGSKPLWLPQYMSSVTVEGGIVSTANDCASFVSAFFSGKFFPQERIEELKKWRMLFSPGVFYFGIGLEKLWVPWIASPFRPMGEILGFWGQTSAFAFYNSKTGLYLTGTANQMNGKGHQAVGNLIFKVIRAGL